jgi:2',3'-cyclic-nucleotide 2'-phosphodiesterase (5'-nucleotidase family)
MLRFLTFALFVLAAIPAATCQPLSGHNARLTILHWNDFHAQNTPWTVRSEGKADLTVGGAAMLLGTINAVRAGRRDVAVFNAGDDFQGTPISTFTAGRSQVEIMNRISPTAVTLGNHEFDYGIDSIKSVFATTSFPVVVSNLVTIPDGRTLALPYEVRKVGQVTIGIVGAVPPDLPALSLEKNLAGYRVRDIDSSLNMYIPALRAEHHVDLVVLVSHMGVDQDTLLAARRSDIDVIVGGHTHTALASPIRKGRAIVVQAGSRGRYLGRLDLDVDLDGDSVASYDGRLIETVAGSASPDSAVAAQVAAYEEIVNARLGERIGTLEVDWDRKEGAPVEINIGNFASDVTRRTAGTDIAFQNVGGIRKDLAAGPITVRDIWEIHPFGNTIVTFSVRGDVLRRMMEFQCAVRGRDFAQVSGLAYVYDSSRPAGTRLVELSVGGRAVDDSALYAVATNNYIGSHLKEFFGLDPASVPVRDTGIVDRDAVIAEIRATPVVASHVEGRIVDRAAVPARR